MEQEFKIINIVNLIINLIMITKIKELMIIISIQMIKDKTSKVIYKKSKVMM